MVHKGTIEKEGVVVESLPGATFRVKLTDEKLIWCHVAGKMRINHIRIMPGDKVKVEVTPYDENKGRIIFRVR